MEKPIIFIDFDGCLASQGKIWFDNRLGIGEAISVYKTISDHDSWAIDTVKQHVHICILSGDNRINEAWAKRRGVDFVFTCAKGFHQDKWIHLLEYLDKKGFSTPDGPEPYYYLGDAMPDFQCMKNARYAFMPADACKILKRLNKNLDLGFVQLETISGQGVFEEMALKLLDFNVIKPGILGGHFD